MIHIAGMQTQVGHRLRQRCAWCGAMLCNYDLTRIAVPAGQEGPPAMWEAGVLVAVEGNASWVVEHEDGADLPDGVCALLDDEVTA